MDCFFEVKPNAERKLQSLIKCSTKYCTVGNDIMNIKTYTLNIKKGTCEDKIYEQNPDLLTFLPRACSIIANNENKTITTLEGPIKFSGATAIDEDPDDEVSDTEATTSTTATTSTNSKITEWAQKEVLEVVETEKANGKFAICKMFEYNGKNFLVFGSKNSHWIVSASCVENARDDFEKLPPHAKKNIIIVSIFNDIMTHFDKLMTIQSYFNDGYSLVGELCDGQHFTPGDNTISWFGLFKNGNAMSTMQALELLNSVGIKTVKYKTVYFPSKNKINDLDNVYLLSRCKNNEGSVLRFRNVETNETILIKSKSAIYIVKRFLREIISKRGKGFKAVEDLRKRFIDAQQYHGLSTEASIRLTKLLFSFSFWMMNSRIPGSVLSHQIMHQNSQNDQNGFNHYWQMFLTSTSNVEPTLTTDDFGPFDANVYIANTSLYTHRDYDNLATVVFMQGVQGAGKSTIAEATVNALVDRGISALYLEQDMFNGDTDACQGALHHAIADASGPQVIIVSRCNVEQSQYKSYLQLAHKLPTKVIFISPKTVDPLYLMLSLSGIIKRSEGESDFLFGQERLPLEQVVEYTVKNFNSFQVHPQAYRLQTYKSTPNFETESIMSLSSNRVKEFINENCEQLNSLRLPLDVIVDETVKIIMNIDFDKIVVPEKPVYIGMAVNECDKNILTAYVDTTVPEANDFTLYNHHITQLFLGGKAPPKDASLVKPGQQVIATIESLVVRKRDKASAFKVTSVVANGVVIEFKNTPHITAKIPLTAKPAESNEFVGKTDDSVEIHECNFVLTLTGFWV